MRLLYFEVLWRMFCVSARRCTFVLMKVVLQFPDLVYYAGSAKAANCTTHFSTFYITNLFITDYIYNMVALLVVCLYARSLGTNTAFLKATFCNIYGPMYLLITQFTIWRPS